MQRNSYWPLNGPSFFSTTEIPSECVSLTDQVAQSASGSNFAARMASRHNSRVCQTEFVGRLGHRSGGISSTRRDLSMRVL
jgi:hypothetical protein